MERRLFVSTRGRKVRETFRPFTVRFPQDKYDKLVARAQANRRSVAAEIELIVEKAL